MGGRGGASAISAERMRADAEAIMARRGGVELSEVEAAIRAAYNELRGRTDLPGGGVRVGNPEMGMPFVDLRKAFREDGAVFLSDLRTALGHRFSRASVDKALADMMKDPSFRIGKVHAQQILTRADRDARLRIGDLDIGDYIKFDRR